MGQKVNPHGLRVGVIAGWDAQWYASKKDFAKFILDDHKIREYIKKKYYTYGVSKVLIERSSGKGRNKYSHLQARYAHRHQGRGSGAA